MIGLMMLEDDTSDSTLSITVTEAEAPREGTNYYCIATNRIGPVIELENRAVATLRSRDVNVSSSCKSHTARSHCHYVYLTIVFGGFESREAEVATIVGGDVALECAINPSNPPPNITWFANDVMITESSRVQFLEERRYLYIQGLTAAERGMRYHCEVNNFLENGMPIRAPINYTLNADIANGSIIVYKNQSTVSSGIGVSVQVVFVAAARRKDGTQAPVSIDCMNTNLVIFGSRTDTFIAVTLTPAARSMVQVDFMCSLFAPGNIPSRDVFGTIIVSGM